MMRRFNARRYFTRAGFSTIGFFIASHCLLSPLIYPFSHCGQLGIEWILASLVASAMLAFSVIESIESSEGNGAVDHMTAFLSHWWDKIRGRDEGVKPEKGNEQRDESRWVANAENSETDLVGREQCVAITNAWGAQQTQLCGYSVVNRSAETVVPSDEEKESNKDATRARVKRT